MDRPLKLHVDASDVGAGAVLVQGDDGGVERLCDREGDACTNLQHFEVYVDSGSVPLVVYTDHNPTAFTALSKPQADAVGFISAVLLFGCSSH